ncbi:faciogenital dysplasia protein [Anaeramoeba flamelloides]|uniref:Faciogenital dysplasia protein n=1 Tax=Anaeramoeba flamelloides TaxID=1746091 RepID=A0AAV7ZUS3_9EUKA|nr:faciogenital dysplasia protein [Anaeramoeba flamelloides]KAJ6238142.1 faciogenital dysplasia protein [Anaeramoeba flamelloides]
MSQQESVLKEKQKRDAHRNTIILETTLVSASKRRPRHLQYENDGLDFQRFVHSELVLGVQSNSNYSQFRIKNSLVRSSQLIIESETETETEIDNKADSDLPESNQQSKKKQENKRNKIPDLNPQNKKKKKPFFGFFGKKKPKKSETQRKTNGLKIQNTPKTTSVRSKPLNEQKKYILIQAQLKRVIQKKYHKMQRKRKKIAEEILETEDSYLRFLNLIVDHFMKPLQKELQLENSQIRTLFNGIESILAFTQLVRTNISTVVSKWNVESCLGKIFIDLIKFSQVYITYVNNYNKGNELLNQLFKNNRKFSNFIKNQEKDDRCRRLDLGSMLIMPVQRLPRYIIFLEQLCKNTPVFHYDYDQIQNAYKMIVEVTTKVNEGKRDFENIQQMESIKQSLIYNDLKLNHISKSPACKFIKSYDAVVFEKRDEMVEKSIIPFKVHLLTEQLWICSPKRGIFFNGGDQFELEYVIGFIFLHKIKKTRRGKIGLLYGKDSNKTIFLLFNDHDTSLDFYQQIQKYAHEKKKQAKKSSELKTQVVQRKIELFYSQTKVRTWRDVLSERQGNLPEKN